MTTIQKKKKLLKEVEKISDSNFLDYLLRLIELESGHDSSAVFPLTSMEYKAIQKAEKDIRSGDVVSEEQADEDISSWL